jgi:hypothetical protein
MIEFAVVVLEEKSMHSRQQRDPVGTPSRGILTAVHADTPAVVQQLK